MKSSSDIEGNNEEDAPETPYDGGNMNNSSDVEGNNNEVAPDPPKNDVNINVTNKIINCVNICMIRYTGITR